MSNYFPETWNHTQFFDAQGQFNSGKCTFVSNKILELSLSTGLIVILSKFSSFLSQNLQELLS